jgi:hypothetical protein
LAKCYQCSNNAYYQLQNGTPLCIRCYEVVQRTSIMQANMYTEQMNNAIAQMEMMSGVPLPRQNVTRMPDSKQVNIHNSTVGAVNMDTVSNQTVNVGGNVNAELFLLIERFCNELAKSEVERSVQLEILEQLRFLATQIGQPKEKRSNALMKPIITSIERSLAAAGDLAGIWSAIVGQLL